jgi:hypothetical protein
VLRLLLLLNAACALHLAQAFTQQLSQAPDQLEALLQQYSSSPPSSTCTNGAASTQPAAAGAANGSSNGNGSSPNQMQRLQPLLDGVFGPLLSYRQQGLTPAAALQGMLQRLQEVSPAGVLRMPSVLPVCCASSVPTRRAQAAVATP